MVEYYFDTASGERVPILHRIIARKDDGNFILRGDAVESTEVVNPAAVRGKMVFALPALGFLPGILRQLPVAVGGLLLTVFFVLGSVKQSRAKKKNGQKNRQLAGGVKESWTSIFQIKKHLAKPAGNEKKADNQAKKVNKKDNMFLPATLVILATIPLATLALGDMVPMANGTPLEN